MKNKREIIKFFMKEKANDLSIFDENYYVDDDYKDIDMFSLYQVKVIYFALKKFDEHSYPSDSEICPHCILFFECCRNTGNCMYGVRHGHCTKNYASTYQKITNEIFESSITEEIGENIIHYLVKWNF